MRWIEMARSSKIVPRTPCRRYLCWMLLLVSGTLLHVWQKVENAGVIRRIDEAEARVEKLEEEHSRLTAAVVFKKKPGAIEEIARGRLGMVYPVGRLSELTFDANPRGEME